MKIVATVKESVNVSSVILGIVLTFLNFDMILF